MKVKHYVEIPPEVYKQLSSMRRSMNRKGHKTGRNVILHRDSRSCGLISYGAYITLGMGITCHVCGYGKWLGEGTRMIPRCEDMSSHPKYHER